MNCNCARWVAIAKVSQFLCSSALASSRVPFKIRMKILCDSNRSCKVPLLWPDMIMRNCEHQESNREKMLVKQLDLIQTCSNVHLMARHDCNVVML